MKFDKSDLLLYAVTDRSWLGEQTLCEQVEEALQGGANSPTGHFARRTKFSVHAPFIGKLHISAPIFTI